jgi:opacity protein-like surface antigen
MNQMNKNSYRHVRHRSLRLTGPAIAIALVVSAAAGAQEWRLEPEVRLGAEYDDNARLRSDPAQIQEIEGFIVEGTLGIGYNTQRAGLEFTPRLRSRNYDETPDVDSNDVFLDLDYNYEGRKSEFAINSSYEIQSIRTAERSTVDFDDVDPGEIPTDPTGITFSNDQRNRFRFSPEWDYDLTERVSLGAQYVYLDVSYDNPQANFLQDYTDHRLEASIGRRFTERTRGYIGTGVRRYDNDLNTNKVDGVGAVIGIESDISEVTRLQAEVGYEKTERDATAKTKMNSAAVGQVHAIQLRVICAPPCTQTRPRAKPLAM